MSAAVRCLEYTTSVPVRAGLHHLAANLRCLVGEAHWTGRHCVLPPLTLAPRHNFGVDRQWEWEWYFDLERSAFVAADGKERPLPLAPRGVPGASAPALVVGARTPIPATARQSARVARRFPRADLPFSEQVAPAAWPAVELRLRPSTRVKQLADQVLERVAALGSGFVAVHARRGDRLTLPQYPSRLTEPPGIHRYLQGRGVAEGSVVFLASDEQRPGFWTALEKRYRLVRYVDFPDLVALVSRRAGALPDNYLLYAVEGEVMTQADMWIETLPGVEPADGSLISEEMWARLAWRRRCYTRYWRLRSMLEQAARRVAAVVARTRSAEAEK